MTALTPGQQALQEAARVEAARVYGHTVPEHVSMTPSIAAAVAEAELQARDRAQQQDVEALIRAGATNRELERLRGVSDKAAQAARKRVMRSAS